MSVPNFLASSFYVREVASTSDVNDYITAIRDELLNVNVPAWTEPSANLFKSPVDADERFMDVLLTRISATNLEIRVRNQNANVVCTRRAQIIGAPRPARLYSGQFHLHFDIFNSSGNEESFFAYILDMTPFPQTFHSQYVTGYGSRTTGDVVAQPTTGHGFMFENGAASLRTDRVRSMGTPQGGTAVASVMTFGPSADFTYFPVDWLSDFGGTLRCAGRLYQQYLSTSFVFAGTEKNIPIDDATLGVFKHPVRPTGTGGMVRLLRIA